MLYLCNELEINQTNHAKPTYIFQYKILFPFYNKYALFTWKNAHSVVINNAPFLNPKS